MTRRVHSAAQHGMPPPAPSAYMLSHAQPVTSGAGCEHRQYSKQLQALTWVSCAVCCVQVINVTPRYAKLHDSAGSVFGWENMELISGRGPRHSTAQQRAVQCDLLCAHSTRTFLCSSSAPTSDDATPTSGLHAAHGTRLAQQQRPTTPSGSHPLCAPPSGAHPLCADRPFQTMLDELKRLKEEYPDRILIASIMEEYNK